MAILSGYAPITKLSTFFPPHSLYIEPFCGGAAIYRLKKPAPKSILIDLDPSPLSAIPVSRGTTVICVDGISWLEEHAGSLPADALIYADPPYVMSTRKSGPLYNDEMRDEQPLFPRQFWVKFWVETTLAIFGKHPRVPDFALVSQQSIINRRVENLPVEVAFFAIGEPLIVLLRYS